MEIHHLLYYIKMTRNYIHPFSNHQTTRNFNLYSIFISIILKSISISKFLKDDFGVTSYKIYIHFVKLYCSLFIFYFFTLHHEPCLHHCNLECLVLCSELNHTFKLLSSSNCKIVLIQVPTSENLIALLLSRLWRNVDHCIWGIFLP